MPGNLYKFDLFSNEWEDLSDKLHGLAPPPLENFGMTSYNRELFIFGGGDFSGELDSLVLNQGMKSLFRTLIHNKLAGKAFVRLFHPI